VTRFDARGKTNSVSDTTVVPEICFNSSHPHNSRSEGRYQSGWFDKRRMKERIQEIYSRTPL